MNLKGLEESLELTYIFSKPVLEKKSKQVSANFNPKAKLNLKKIDPTLKSFSEKRLNEFIAGRICALKVINEIVPFKTFLQRGKDNLPLWPTEIVGSITHSGPYVSAAAALRTDVLSLGIDSEEIFDQKTAKDLVKEILNPDEKKFLSFHNFREIITLIYSAKESVFKALYPINHFFLNFSDLKVESINFSEKTFEIALRKNKLFSNFLIKGKFQISSAYVYTGIEIPRI